MKEKESFFTFKIQVDVSNNAGSLLRQYAGRTSFDKRVLTERFAQKCTKAQR